MKTESVRATLRKHRTSPKLFSDFNTLQFASVMAMVVFALLSVFMTITPYVHHGVSADPPKVLHPIAMPGANREDALKVMITRDGKIYFGTDRINCEDLAAKIQDRLKDREVERKVYIIADMRAHWGGVKLALDGVGSAGIIRVAFLADQGQVPKLSR